MSNYFRITGYCPEKDFSFIMDCYGKLEKKWQFSAELVKRGLKIIEVSDDEQFLEGNIPLLVNPTDKFVLRAYANGKPKYITQTIRGTECSAVKLDDKIYIPNKSDVYNL
ncbi:MAG TPA: hypothetical protein DHU79_02875 [Clostridiales bacterium]|nr:hypothetical protein [Clostridiales bacterium]